MTLGEKDIVLDTSVVIQALQFDDTASRIIAKMKRECFKMHVSDDLESEYTKKRKATGYTGLGFVHLANELKTLGKYVNLDTASVGPFIRELERSRRPEIRRARKDHCVLASSMAGRCSIIVATDRHVKNCSGFLSARQIRVLSMTEFLDVQVDSSQ